MIGPVGNSLGTAGSDFFQHGLVAFASGGRVFAVHEICLTGGWKINLASLSGWDVERALGAGQGNVSVAAGWDEAHALPGGVPECE